MQVLAKDSLTVPFYEVRVKPQIALFAIAVGTYPALHFLVGVNNGGGP